MSSRIQASVRAALDRAASVEPDGLLLTRFASDRDEAAFAEIVRRHGPMVLGVARRALGAAGEAEDVFQATFLLLAARSRSLSVATPIASWLHGAARRTAANARVAAIRRTARERRSISPRGEPLPEAAASLRELQAMLDEELARVPAQHREAFLLCCVEGHGRSETAKLLGCSEGTVASRVARARDVLRAALTRRGIELAAAMTAIAVGNSAGAAAAPAALVATTVRLAGLVHAPGDIGDIPPAIAALVQPARGLVNKSVWAVLASCALAAGLFAGADTAPPESRSVPDAAPATRSPGLDGNWTLTLPAGFRYEVRLERLADRFYRLHSHTVFGGLYEHDGDSLVLQTPAAGLDPRFRWKLAGGAASLANEAAVFGQRYAGASLKRSDAKRPPRDSIDLGQHLLRITAADGRERGVFVVPDSRDVKDADLFARARSGAIEPGWAELIALAPLPGTERLEVVSFDEKDRKIRAVLKCTPGTGTATKAFHLRAWLAPLPPGKYEVEIRFDPGGPDSMKTSFTVPQGDPP